MTRLLAISLLSLGPAVFVVGVALLTSVPVALLVAGVLAGAAGFLLLPAEAPSPPRRRPRGDG